MLPVAATRSARRSPPRRLPPRPAGRQEWPPGESREASAEAEEVPTEFPLPIAFRRSAVRNVRRAGGRQGEAADQAFMRPSPGCRPVAGDLGTCPRYTASESSSPVPARNASMVPKAAGRLKYPQNCSRSFGSSFTAGPSSWRIGGRAYPADRGRERRRSGGWEAGCPRFSRPPGTCGSAPQRIATARSETLLPSGR
jgi:hypothetical protein